MGRNKQNLTKTQTQTVSAVLKDMGAEEKAPKSKGYKGVLNYKSPTLQVQVEVWLKTLRKEEALDKSKSIIRRNSDGEPLVYATINADSGEIVERQKKGYVALGDNRIVPYSEIQYSVKDEQGGEKPVKPFSRNTILNMDIEKGIPNYELPLYLAGETKLVRVWSKNLNALKQVCEDIKKSGTLPYCPLVLSSGFKQYRAVALPMEKMTKEGKERFALCLLATQKKIVDKELFGEEDMVEAENGEGETLDLEMEED